MTHHPTLIIATITKNFRYLKWRVVSWSPYFRLFWGLGKLPPLHKPYPYSLYRFSDSSILGMVTPCNSHPALWGPAKDHVLMAGCTLDHCQLGGVKWPSAVLRQARGSNVASWHQQKSANRIFGMWNTPPKSNMEGPKIMGLGKGDSGFKYGVILGPSSP